MTDIVRRTDGGGGGGGGGGSDLAEVVGMILDKGVVIDAHLAVSLVGIRLLTVDARVVVASVDTYLRFAEATNRLDLSATRDKGLPDLVSGPKAGLVEKAGDALGEIVGGSGSDSGGNSSSGRDGDPDRVPRRRRREED
ncbi:gas vesicle protein [Plantactinospora sp. BB1]|nr:gas vesicle protein GvpJ [Plantactinospora sp. BB1]AVT40457.1 gas vesicle protein [Plantactinospora sp. BB1]